MQKQEQNGKTIYKMGAPLRRGSPDDNNENATFRIQGFS